MTGLVLKHALKERKNDCYETPAVAVQALLRVESLPHCLWEPACGRGAIVNVLRAHGHEVVATDLVNYGLPITPPGYYGVDFLMEWKLPIGCECILTNPPFKLAAQFVAHAFDLGCPLVIMLLRWAFYEAGTGKARAHRARAKVLDEISPARNHVFRKRLPMMHRDGWDGPKASSKTPHAWFVWDRAHRGPTGIDRISWIGEAAP